MKSNLQKSFRNVWLVELLFQSISVLIFCYQSIADCENLKVEISELMSRKTELKSDNVLWMPIEDKKNYYATSSRVL